MPCNYMPVSLQSIPFQNLIHLFLSIIIESR
jgi:hypothetical protein